MYCEYYNRKALRFRKMHSQWSRIEANVTDRTGLFHKQVYSHCKR